MAQLRFALSCLLFLAASGLSAKTPIGLVTSAVAQPLSNFAPEGYVDFAALWPPPFAINVCWEPSPEAFREEKSITQKAIHDLIEKKSSIVLTWSECTTGSVGIRVRIADEIPRSAVGRQLVRDPRNPHIIRKNAAGQALQLPTQMVLNFTFERSFTSCRSDKNHCIAAIAVHEMLHALGFLHEQLRPDTPAECKEKYAGTVDFAGISPFEATKEYDKDSHMNYCANMYRRPIALSKGDIDVLRSYYTIQ